MSTADTIRAGISHNIPDSMTWATPPLDSSCVHYYARSFGDPMARLFWKDDRLWMGIMPPYGRTFTRLANLAVMNELIQDKLMVGFERSAQSHPGFDVLYRLASTPRITYWHEWSPKMLRAAALRLIFILQKLAAHGLTLRNPHPWNILYDGLSFVYMNPGSIVQADAETFTRSYEKVARFFIRPLLLIESGKMHLAARLIEDPRDGVLAEDMESHDGEWAEWSPKTAAEGISPFLDRLAGEVSSLNCSADGGRWIDYFATDCDFSSGTSWSRKQQALEVLLKDTSIHSVLDLGANTGHYARVAAERGCEVIAADFDPALVDATFEETRKAGLPLYPVTMDFSHPVPARGVDGGWFPPATRRLESDLVLCFALCHHMVFGKYRLDFEQVARGVHSFCRRWALVEYVERGKIRPAEWRPEADGWYTADHLAAVLRRYFPVVTVLPPANDGRRLLVCGTERRLV
jgi:SAM-dependent methyltransferase